MSQVCRAAYLLSALLGVALIVSLVWKPAPAAQFHRIDAARIPMRLGAYHGADEPLDEGTMEALYSAQVINRRYRSSVGPDIWFTLIGGADRDALHDPRSCIVGSGGRIDNDRVDVLPGAGLNVRMCDAIYQGSDGHDSAVIGDTIFFYVTRHGIVANATQIRAQLLLTAFEQRGEPVFFFKCAAPMSADEPADVRKLEHQRLVQFASDMWRKTAPVLAEGLK